MPVTMNGKTYYFSAEACEMACTNRNTYLRWVRENKFHDKRKWRADFCQPVYKIIVEIEGGIFVGGRHTRGAGFIKDMEK